MRVFESIRKAKETLALHGAKVEEILYHRNLVARGFLYLVDYNDKLYILINAYDLDMAMGSLPTYVIEGMDVSPNIWGIPLFEDSEKIRKVLGGIIHVLDGNNFLSAGSSFIQNPTRY